MKFGRFKYGEGYHFGQDWLIKRLSPSKRNSPRWRQLALSIQQYWQEMFDDNMDRAKSLRSIYTASEDDQLLLIEALGEYFETDIPANNRPIAVAWRKLELEQKETELPLMASLNRAVPEIDVEWVPLWAYTDERYGTAFFPDYYAAAGIDRNIFLTSRGMLVTDWETIEDLAWLDTLRTTARRWKPLHILFAGIILRIEQELLIDVIAEQAGFLLSKNIFQRYPWCAEAHVDGTWHVGTEHVIFHLGQGHKIDGSWVVGDDNEPPIPRTRLRYCNIEAALEFDVTSERPSNYIEVLLEPESALGTDRVMTRLDGEWYVGCGHSIWTQGSVNILTGD